MRLKIALLSLLCASLSQPSVAQPISLKFCFEDKSVAPLYLGEGQAIAEPHPGASIEILRLLDSAFSEFSISYTRAPWRRCLADIKNNKVDSIIAAYREGREAIAVFPQTEQKQIASQYAISRLGLCLVGKQAFRDAYTSQNNSHKTFTLATPYGYGINRHLQSDKFDIYNTLSHQHSYALLEKGVVDASLDICMVNQQKVSNYPFKSNVAEIYPPVQINEGYLVFSEAFYQQHPILAQTIWQWLGQQNNDAIYLKYIKNNYEQ